MFSDSRSYVHSILRFVQKAQALSTLEGYSGYGAEQGEGVSLYLLRQIVILTKTIHFDIPLRWLSF